MSSKAAKHHDEAHKSYESASKKHKMAGEAYKSGDHKKASHFATSAQGHATKGHESSKEANKTHAEEYGDKE